MSLAAASISLSGMNAATTRLEAAASNIANVQTTGTVPDANGASTAYRPVTVTQSEVAGGGVAATIVPVRDAYVLQSDPSSPDADPNGLVAAPNVDLAGQAVDVLLAKTSYEASLKTLKVATDMQKSAIDILR